MRTADLVGFSLLAVRAQRQRSLLTILGIAVGISMVLGALMMLGIGFYGPCLIMISLLGMDPRVSYPIMMGACAFLMPAGSIQFVRKESYDLRTAIAFLIAGPLAVLIAAPLVDRIPLLYLRFLVLAVVRSPASFVVEVAQPGASSSSTAASDALILTRTAVQALGGHRIVRAAGNGRVDYADANEASHGDDVLGLTLHACDAGASVQVLAQGAVTEPSWGFTPQEPVFLGNAGQLTQTPAGTAFDLVCGFAETATAVLVWSSTFPSDFFFISSRASLIKLSPVTTLPVLEDILPVVSRSIPWPI